MFHKADSFSYVDRILHDDKRINDDYSMNSSEQNNSVINKIDAIMCSIKDAAEFENLFMI